MFSGRYSYNRNMNKKFNLNIKTILLLGFLLVGLGACNFPLSQNNAFDAQVATQAAYAFTQTAQVAQILATSNPVTATPETPTLTPTVEADNPKEQLGAAAWQDTLANGSSFGLDASELQISGTNATVWVDGGSFNMYRPTASGGYIWYCAYPNIANFYVEAKFETQNCSGSDEYGLFIRKPDFSENTGYYFIATGEGKFNLMRWTSSGSTLLGNWETSEFLNKGLSAVNVLGIWAEDSTLKLYINDHFVAEFEDSALTSGYFGLFTNAKQSAGMLVKMDEITYWNLP